MPTFSNAVGHEMLVYANSLLGTNSQVSLRGIGTPEAPGNIMCTLPLNATSAFDVTASVNHACYINAVTPYSFVYTTGKDESIYHATFEDSTGRVIFLAGVGYSDLATTYTGPLHPGDTVVFAGDTTFIPVVGTAFPFI